MEQLDQEYRNKPDYRTALMLSIVILTGLIVFAALAFKFRCYTMDDSYITFRYVSNLVSGHGLVFNPGELPRPEGITSPLYALLLSPAAIRGLDIVVFSKTLGLMACFFAALLVCLTIYKLTRSLTQLLGTEAITVSAAGAAWLLSNPYVVGNALSGMETALSALAVSAFLFLIVKQLSSDSGVTLGNTISLGITAVLIPMLRPEMGLLVAVVFIMGIILCSGSRHFLLSALGVFSILGTTYYCIRFWYYGLPLPLPFYIKQGGIGLNGLAEVKSYLKNVILLIPAICFAASFALDRSHTRRKPLAVCLLVILAAIVIEIVYYCTIYHIMGLGFRYFIPMTFGLVLPAFVGIAFLYDLSVRSKLSQMLSLPCLLGFFFFLLLIGNALAYRPAQATFVDWYSVGIRRNVQIARAMAKASEGIQLHIALNDCGAIPFYTRFPTIDLGGLNNRRIARVHTSEATCDELRKERPHLIILVSQKAHDPGAVFGWERLSHTQVVDLGYEYVGTMTVGKMPNGFGYHLLVYGNTENKAIIRPFLIRLRDSGILKIPQDDTHSEHTENNTAQTISHR